MANDKAEELTLEALKQFGTTVEREEYRASIERRHRMTEEHDRRITAMEAIIARQELQLQNISNDAIKTHSEIRTMLKNVSDEVKIISTTQIREAARKEGAEEQNGKIGAVAKYGVPMLVGVLTYAGMALINDVAQSVNQAGASSIEARR